MAGGGKETPRQKMVGMMYLVLTALLALQVSNSVLEKFEFIRQSLDNSTIIAQKSTSAAVEGIQAKVDKDKNEKDMAVLDNAKKVKTLTAQMMAYMSEFDTKIIEVSGGWVEGKVGGELAGAKDYDKQMAWSLGIDGAKNGKAYELKKKLDKYVDDINGLVDSLNVSKFAKSGAELYPDDENQKSKDFAELNFDHTPTVACRAIIAQFKSEIASVETKAVERLAQKIGATKLKFDKVFAVALPNSRVVASGTKYSAELFIAASSNSVIPRMTAGGTSLKVDAESGRGLYEVTARTSKAREKRSWKGTISIPNPSGGGDTTFQVEEEYEIVAPVIQVQSAAVAALYLNCGNELNVQVPALGDSYNPSFSASGGQVIKGKTRGVVTVVPNGKEVTLSVRSGDFSGKRSFKVRKVPLPAIAVFAGSKKANLNQGEPASALRTIRVKAIPDQSFKAFLPKDARYKIARATATLARGRRALGKVSGGGSLQLGGLLGKAKEGDRVIIEVSKVSRGNFLNKTEPVNLGTQYITIPVK